MSETTSRVPKPEQLIETIEIINETMGELIEKAGNFPPFISAAMITSVLVDTQLVVATARECIAQGVEPEFGAVAVLAHEASALEEAQRGKGFLAKLSQSQVHKKKLDIAAKVLNSIKPIWESNLKYYDHNNFISAVLLRNVVSKN